MTHSIDQRARWRCWVFAGLAVLTLFSTGASSARADDDDDALAVGVEEDWQLTLKEPDEATQAPQVTCVISPRNDGVFAAFNLNHKAYPQYDAGGLHLQLWNGEIPLASAKSSNNALLATPGEVISWTVRMQLRDGQLTFEIVNGHSTTWGDFGGDGSLKASVASDLNNLNQYDPDSSAANSGIGYAGNRVQSLKLTEVRVGSKSGNVAKDQQTRVVYPHD